MIPAGNVPSPVLTRMAPDPGLAGRSLQAALSIERGRLVFLAEHLDTPNVSEGVADGILDALAAVVAALELQTRLSVFGDAP